MYGTCTKKMLNMLILDILREESDSDHKLLQQDIIDRLDSDYGITCERRTVRSNIISLQEMGYKIVSDKGYYLKTREFSDAEIRLLIDSVFSSSAVTDKEAHQLAKKLEGFSNKYFKSHVKHIHSTSSGKNADNQKVMDSIAKIDTAISKGKKVSFSYLQYGPDFKLHKKRDIRYVVSPYQMLSHKGKYYLMGNYDAYDNISHYRLDRITDVEILKDPGRPMDTVKGLENGFNIAEHLAEHVYMFSSESIRIKMLVNENLMDALIDDFGKNFRAKYAEGDNLEVDIKCSPDAFFYWAMQYGQHVEVLAPESMRERLKKASLEMYQKYK